MLSARAWNPSAIVRLILCLVVCYYCGALVMATLLHVPAGARQDLRFYRLTASALGCAATAIVFVYRPWNPDNVASRLGGYLVCLYGGFGLAAWAQKAAPAMTPSIGQMICAALSFQGAALMLVPHFLREQGLSWKEAFGLGHDRREAVMKGVILACIFLPLGMALQWLSAEIITHLPHLQLKPQEQEVVQTLQMAVTWKNRLALGIITILVAPAAEEILFRGIIYPAIKQAGFPRLALWGTAIMFAAIHVNLVKFLPLLVLALSLALLYEKTDNLLAPITAHALFNAMNFVILYSTLGPSTPIK
jgi:membrane protease YdiL (CAAX protease family)